MTEPNEGVHRLPCPFWDGEVLVSDLKDGVVSIMSHLAAHPPWLEFDIAWFGDPFSAFDDIRKQMDFPDEILGAARGILAAKALRAQGRCSGTSGGPVPIRVCFTKKDMEQSLPAKESRRLFLFKDIVDEARLLTFDKILVETVRTLKYRYGFDIIYVPLEFDGNHRSVSVGNPRASGSNTKKELLGLAYGVDTNAAKHVWENLVQDGYLIPRSYASRATGEYEISSKGHARIESGGTTGPPYRVFLVHRFNEAMKMRRSLYKRVEEESQGQLEITDIDADREHERRIPGIINRIREADCVLVDCTDHNFNIGYELGYAHALAKPILLTQEKRGKDVLLPFDVFDVPCVQYDLSPDSGSDAKIRDITDWLILKCRARYGSSS